MQILEKLRREAAECLVLSNLAPDPEKRELFARVARHINGLASAFQNEVAAQPPNVVPDRAVVNQRQTSATSDIYREPPLSPARDPSIDSRQMPWWLVAVVLLAVATGALVWPRTEQVSAVTALESKAEPPPAPQEDTKQAIAKLQSAEEETRKALSAEAQTRKALSEQLGALAARLDNLEKARAEMVEPTTKRAAETARQPRQRKHRSPVFYSTGVWF
jgi:hypothetical protein